MISDFQISDLSFPLFKDFVFTSGTKKNTNQPYFEIILTWDLILTLNKYKEIKRI